MPRVCRSQITASCTPARSAAIWPATHMQKYLPTLERPVGHEPSTLIFEQGRRIGPLEYLCAIWENKASDACPYTSRPRPLPGHPSRQVSICHDAPLYSASAEIIGSHGGRLPARTNSPLSTVPRLLTACGTTGLAGRYEKNVDLLYQRPARWRRSSASSSSLTFADFVPLAASYDTSTVTFATAIQAGSGQCLDYILLVPDIYPPLEQRSLKSGTTGCCVACRRKTVPVHRHFPTPLTDHPGWL